MRCSLHWIYLIPVVGMLTACSTTLPERPESGRHIAPPSITDNQASIPDILSLQAVVPAPAEEADVEVYTLVVHDMPVRELLFALARDTALNIDIHPAIAGNVSLNAIDQTLPQILSRLARQIDLRWKLSPPNLVIEPDSPQLRYYRIDYVNIARRSEGTVGVSTAIATTGAVGEGSSAGSNNSTTNLTMESNNTFWQTLLLNLRAIVGEAPEGAEDSVSAIIANPESGMIAARATDVQHREIQAFLDQVVSRSLRQVMIEATIVEVSLNEQHQTGVDWSAIRTGNFNFSQQLTGVNLASAPVSTLLLEGVLRNVDLGATIKMLEQFGDLKVHSTPKVMALNNQTAILKVVDNNVYFTIDVDIEPATPTSPSRVTYTSNVHTVPVGFVMAVTPQVGENEQITLNVRPTISRILRYINDPNPALAQANVISRIPEIQVREVESILKVGSGQVAVLGGLMQDSIQQNTAGTPGLSRLPLFGNLFSYKDRSAAKTELIIFLRPVVIRQPSLQADLHEYRDFLSDKPRPSDFGLNRKGNKE